MSRVRGKEGLEDKIAEIPAVPREALVEQWAKACGRPPPKGISRRLLEYSAAYQLQVKAYGGLKPNVRRKLRLSATEERPARAPVRTSRKVRSLQPGTRLMREWHGQNYSVEVTENGFRCGGEHYTSLSQVAGAITGARWSGPRFFGL